jgi:eukaryotic-like serine/threonine-protein kinase
MGRSHGKSVFMTPHDHQTDAVRAPLPDVSATQASLHGSVLAQAAPPDRLGDFRILRVIGRGGMGVVYEAEQVSLGRRVALKLLPQALHLDAVRKARFEREARAAARLHHTNIVPVFGVGEHDGLPYYVMQLISGRGLDVVLAEQRQTPGPGVPHTLVEEPWAELGSKDLGATVTLPAVPGETPPPFTLGPRPESNLIPVPAAPPASGGSSASGPRQTSYWRDVARIGAQAADALEYAHRQGILHRDVKPSNLLLDAEGTVWVADFGLAKADDSDALTQVGDIIGTVRYMPPEAFEGQTDRRTDVYSLGLTLYELLALRPAYTETDRNKIIKLVMTTEPRRLDLVNPAIPRDLVTIVHKATERDPDRRYQRAGDLAADLQHFLDDEPIKARRQTQLERYLRWARRHPDIAVLGAVLTAVLVLGTVASLLAAGYFNQLRLNEAQSARNERTARQTAENANVAERWERYRSNIAAASAALQLQKSDTARRALEAAPEQNRHWEWQHLHNQLDGSSRVLSMPDRDVNHLARTTFVLSPDGRQFATASMGHAVELWDAASDVSQPVHVLRGHTHQIWDLAYSPDGRQLATGAEDSMRIWDPATGQQLFLLPSDQKPRLTFSSDSTRLLSIDENGRYRLWDPATGQLIATLGPGRATQAHPDASFSPDSRRVAAAFGKELRLYDVATGRQLASLGPHEWDVEQVYFSPGGKRILTHKSASAGPDTAYLWDAETGGLIAKLMDHLAPINFASFNATGTLLATASEHPENVVRLWDATNGRLLHTLPGHLNTLRDLRFSPDGTRLASTSLDQTARLWDVKTGSEIAVLRGHWSSVDQVVFSPDSRRLITASADETMRLWDAKTGEAIAVLRGHSGTPWGHFSLDGSRLISACLDGTARFWNLELLERNGVLRGHRSFVYDVAFSPDGKRVASAGWDGTARLWDPTTGRRTARLDHPKPFVTSLAFSRDGRTLATANTGRGVLLWDLATGRHELAVPLAWHSLVALSPDGKTLACTDFRRSLAVLYDIAARREISKLTYDEPGTPADPSVQGEPLFSPDGATLVTNASGGKVLLWDVATWKVRDSLPGYTGSALCFAFSPDSKLLAFGGRDDKTLRIWDLDSREQVVVHHVGGQVLGLAFSPDGTRLAAGCRDNTIRLFDVATGKDVAELRGHAGYVKAVAWSPDGSRLVSGSGDTTVRIWDSLSVQERARREAPKQ